MKTLIMSICGICLVFHTYAQIVTNDLSTHLEAIKASGDAKQIIAALPDAETLWTQNPKAYFEFMRSASFSLTAACSSSTNVAPQMRVMFTNVLSKPISTNYQVVLDTLEPQVNAAMSFGSTLTASDHKKVDLLALAQFIGRIQDQIISNPPSMAIMMSGGSQQAIDAVQASNLKFSWQQALRSNKRTIEFLLFSHYNYAYNDHSDTNFTEKLIFAARLSGVEAEKFRSGAIFP